MYHDIVTSNNYYATDNHFIKSTILKPLTKSKTQEPYFESKRFFELQRWKLLKTMILNYIVILKLYFWNILE